MIRFTVSRVLTMALAAAASSSLVPATLQAHDETADREEAVDPRWRASTVYFLLTDRFANGDPANDQMVGRKRDGGPLRSFEGGDLKGLTQKIEQGWFNDLGVDAIWTTPVIENVHGFVDEGEWGLTYAYHGYWPKDWTAVDPNLGTEADFAAMVKAAHGKGLRVIVDVIANHAGPGTPLDPRWPEIALVAKAPEQTTNIGGGWHTDHSYDQIPAMGSILVARVLPPSGGDTLFAHMGAAYDALDAETRAAIEGLQAFHTADHKVAVELVIRSHTPKEERDDDDRNHHLSSHGRTPPDLHDGRDDRVAVQPVLRADHQGHG